MAKASTQRMKLSAEGEIMSCTSRPTTALPAHNKGGITSSTAVPGVSFCVMGLHCNGACCAALCGGDKALVQ
ncbi:hypothetical protein D3C72_1935700 [compost metagenome]